MPEILCPECLEKGLEVKMHRAGKIWSGRKKKQRHRCPKCGRTTIIDNTEGGKEDGA